MVPPPRVIALATAAVLCGGVAVAATNVGDPSSAPRALATPTPARSPVAPTPPPLPRPRHPKSVKPTPARHPRAAAKPLFPLPAKPAYPSPCPPPPIPPGPPFVPPKAAVKARDLPAVLPVPRHRHVDIHAVGGKGMWLTTWPDTRLDVPAVVARASRAGLHQLWVRTGGSLQGWYGDRLLSGLLPAAHAAGLKVVAWDFPSLSDPMRDVRRADHVLTGTFAGQRVDAFSPDIETISEGTFNTDRRVRIYLSRVRNDAGD